MLVSRSAQQWALVLEWDSGQCTGFQVTAGEPTDFSKDVLMYHVMYMIVLVRTQPYIAYLRDPLQDLARELIPCVRLTSHILKYLTCIP